MRKVVDGLYTLVQEDLRGDPFSGQAFVFRGGAGRLIKVLWWDGEGLCLFSTGGRRSARLGPGSRGDETGQNTMAR